MHEVQGNVTDLYVKVLGRGTRVLLIHGSGGTCDDWFQQHPLAARYTLLMPDRRGYARSPPAATVDYQADAKDIAELLGVAGHLVGHSYGGVGCLLAAAQRPEAVLSLTVLEPPLLGLVRGDPEADGVMARLAVVYETMREASLEEFDAAFDAALGLPHRPTTLDPVMREALASMMKECLAFDARIPFDRLAGASFLKLVVSGGWNRVFTAVCDEIARRIHAERVAFGGSGHSIPGKPLNDALEALWGPVEREPERH